LNKTKKYLVEVVEEKPKCLLVYERSNRFVQAFTKKIAETHVVYESSQLEGRWSEFDLVVFLGVVPEDFDSLRGSKKVFFIFFGQSKLYREAHLWAGRHLKKYKVVNLGISHRTIAELVDFVIYKTPTPYSFNFSLKVIPKPLIKLSSDPKRNLLLSLKILIISVAVVNLVALTFFLGQWGLLFNLARSNPQQSPALRQQLRVLEKSWEINEVMKNVPKNTLFWVPGIESWLGFIDTTNTSVKTLILGSKLLDGAGTFSALITKKNKSPAEVAEIKLRLKHLQSQFGEFSNNYYLSYSLWQKTNLPFFNSQKQRYLDKLKETEEYLNFGEKVLEQLPTLLGAKEPREYLVLFMNNMELRPGGGFIGSVASLSFDNYSLKELRVYDVYTLDGQLRTHIDPPLPIREHLNQPHWFLRDSNFSPDFSVNAEEALRFVGREVKWEGYDGVIGITLSSVQKIIALFPNFYLPDYNEEITPDNFFLKAQSYAEKGFFPGSHKKKEFLQAVFETLVLKLESGEFDSRGLSLVLRGLFEEKQAVVYFVDPAIQAIYDELFWTGRVVSVGCNFSENCFSDYLYVVDANLGVNKTNFFIQRTIRLSTTINDERRVANVLAVDYYNESVPEIFPGGDYKNYVQVYLPKNTRITEILVEGEPATDYDLETELGLRKIGLLLEIPAARRKNLVIKYEFEQPFANTQQYQLIVQKQIGSINNDFVFQMQLPPGLNLKQANFSPIVREKSFVYNTFLQKDRILVVDFKQ